MRKAIFYGRDRIREDAQNVPHNVDGGAREKWRKFFAGGDNDGALIHAELSMVCEVRLFWH